MILWASTLWDNGDEYPNKCILHTQPSTPGQCIPHDTTGRYAQWVNLIFNFSLCMVKMKKEWQFIKVSIMHQMLVGQVSPDHQKKLIENAHRCPAFTDALTWMTAQCHITLTAKVLSKHLDEDCYAVSSPRPPCWPASRSHRTHRQNMATSY